MCLQFATNKKAHHEMLRLARTAAGVRLQARSWDLRVDLSPLCEGEQSWG